MSNKATEILQCALINCDNIRSLGQVGIDIVKIQIQDAIDLLEGEEGGEK